MEDKCKLTFLHGDNNRIVKGWFACDLAYQVIECMYHHSFPEGKPRISVIKEKVRTFAKRVVQGYNSPHVTLKDVVECANLIWIKTMTIELMEHFKCKND